MHLRPSNTDTTARLFGAVLTASIALLVTAPQADAELLIGLTRDNNLLSFDSATPGTTATTAITGILAGDTLVGIDRRPQAINNMSSTPGPNNGLLYAIGVNAAGSGRIYTLNETTGVATPGFTLAADPTDATAPFPFTTIGGAPGSGFGIDFNPTVDRLRLTSSSSGQNLRINVDTGLVQLDVPLSFPAPDVNQGETPAEFAVAYANNFGNATSTIQRGVDGGQTPDALVRHLNPNAGTLTTVTDLPFDSSSDLGGYDISGLSGTPYFAVNVAGVAQLYAAGPGGVALTGPIAAGGATIVGLAAPVGTPIPEPGTALVGLALCGIIGASRARRRS